MDQSVKVAQLWQKLDEVKTSLDNEMIPLSVHLKAVDKKLLTAMEVLSKEIAQHFKKFNLTVQLNKLKK